MEVPLLLEATTPVCVLDARVLAHESFSLGPLVCFHCHGQWQAAVSESCIKSQVNTSPCLFPLGKINK